MTKVSTILPSYARAPLSFLRGEGTWLITETNERYLDFGAGVAVTALGHAHPELVAVLKDQAERLWHTSNLYEIPNQKGLADLLVEKTFADTVFFTNSGTEAMEACVKMARKYFASQGAARDEIITFSNSFHGRTLGMISASGGSKLTDGFGPLLPGFIHVPFGDHEALKAAITPRTAAIMIEPIQGEGGILPVPEECLRGLRKICNETGALLIFDEIQCGMGRAGTLFAHESAKISPDIMGIAKGLGAGFPIGACLASQKAASGMGAGSHGSTFGGNPLACRVGKKVLEIIADPDFLRDVNSRARRLRAGLERVIGAFSTVFSEVRGKGLMLGVVCKKPNTDIISACYDQKLLTVPGGQNTIRILPPLNVSEDEIDLAVKRLSAAATANM